MLLWYGQKKIKVDMPVGVVWKELKLPQMQPIKDPVIAIKEALDKPISSPPLKDCIDEGDKVCIIVNDSTRIARSDLFLPILLDELRELNVNEKNIFIVFSTGTHRPLERSEMISIVGKQIAKRLKLYNHDCHDEKELVYLGETTRNTPVYINKKVVEADKRILTGSIVYHFFAGFGGGRKALVPGVAGFKTIKANHSLMITEKARLGILEENPVHEDLLEAALMVGGNFIVNVVLDGQKQILGIFSGDMVEAHESGCKLAQKAYGVKINTLADVVIASCGGFPKDINVYQAQKTLENAMLALNKGGKIILLAQCIEGIGSAVFEEWAERYNSFADIEHAICSNFQIGGHKAYAVARSLEKGEVILISDLHPQQARALGFIPSTSLNKAMSMVFKEVSSNKLTYIIPEGSLIVPIYDISPY